MAEGDGEERGGNHDPPEAVLLKEQGDSDRPPSGETRNGELRVEVSFSDEHLLTTKCMKAARTGNTRIP
jgi:hypothetical protein